MAGIKFDFTSDNKNLLNSAKQAQTGVTNAINGIERAGRGIESTFSRIKSSVLGGFADIAKGMAGLTAMLQAGNFFKTLIDDAGKFNVAMKEVSTLSEEVANNLQLYKDKVVDMTTQIPIGATEAAKALYQIESAGHHGADGLNVLRESAKGAIGGVTDTATAADAITTILNAYKMESSEAQHVSDLLFTTVRLGKTNMSQLGSTIAQVAPVAASFGVSIEDVLAAIASLTKQGTKTSVAVRQVRDAITATTKSMGDSAFQGRSFLDAMDEVAQKAQGSNNALRQDLGTLQALNAVLSLTGKNSQAARQDVADMQNSVGAAEAAYQKMASTAGTQTTLLRNNIFKAILPLADEMKSMSGDIAKSINKAFDSGAMDKALVSLEAFIAAYATYRGLLTATTAWNSAALGGTYKLQIAELQQLIPLKELDGQADLQAAVAKGTLTTEQAKLVASLRAETEARYEEVMAAETEARANLKALTAAEAAATANLAAANEMVAAAQARVAAAMQSGSASEIEAAKEELNTAERLKNTAVTELNTIQRQKNGAAIMVNVTEKNADTAAQLMDNAATGAGTKATGLLATAKLQLSKAIKAVNSSFLASPLFWIAATIAAVTYAVYKLVTAENAHDAAIRRANEAMDEAKKKLDERRSAIDSLIRTIQDPNATAYQKAKAYNELATVAKDITDAYSLEALAAMGAADAQKALNESMERAEFDGQEKKIAEVQEKIEAHKKSLEQWQKEYEKYSRYSGYEVGDDGYNKKQQASSGITLEKGAIENLQAELDVLQAAYDRMKTIREEAIESDSPIEIRIQEAKENESEKQRIFDFFDDVMVHVEDIQSSQNNLNFDEAQSKLDAYISEIQSDLDGLHQQVEQNPLDQKLQMQEKEKTDLLNRLLQWQADLHTGGYTTIPLFFKAEWSSAQQALNQARGYYQNLANQTVANGAMSMGQVFDKAKKEYKAAAKEWNRVKNNMYLVTPEQYTKAKTTYETKKSGFEAIGGDPDGKKAKATASAARKAINQEKHLEEEKARERQKLFEQQMADEERIAKERQEMEDAIEDARIAKITNNAEREREERRVQHERDLRQIQEQADKFKQEAYKRAEDDWNAKNKDKTKVFSDTEVGKAGWQAMSLDENQQAIIDAQMEQENAEYQRYIDERYRNELQATNDFLKEYGNYEQKKLAITQDYEQKIAQESTPTEKASLSLQRDKELKELEKSELEQKIDWSGVFSDLSGHTEEYLTGLRDQLQEILKTGDLPVDQMATIQEKIREIDDEVKKQGGMFKFQSDLQREHTRRLKEAKDAQERLNKAKSDEAQKSMDVFSATQKIKDLMESIGEGDTDFDPEGFLTLFEEGTPEYEQAEEALRVYLEAQGKLTDSQKEAKDAAAKAAEAQDAANERLDQAVARHLANVNEWIQTYLGDLPGLLSELGLGGVGEKVSQGMSAVSNAAGAAADFASRNYVGAALKAVSAIKDFGRVFGIGGGNAAEINKQLEKLSRRNEILTKSIDRLTDAMSNKGGAGAIREYEKLAELQKELEANLLKQMQLQMDYHSAHHSFDYYWGGFSQSEIDEFNKRNGTNWNGDLNDLTADLAAMLQADADMWQKILDTGKGGYGERVADWIEQLAEQAGKAKEQTDALYASLTAGTTRESVFDDFLSQMYELANGSKDVMDNIAENWQEMVNKMVINNIIGEEMREKLSGWYTELAEKNKDYTNGLISEEEYLAALERLKNAYTDYVNEGQQQIEQFTELGIIQPIKDAADEVESIFGNLHDVILDDLTDLEMTGEKMARKLNEAITKQLIEKLIFNDEFNQWLEDWENRYNEAVSGESPDQTTIDQLLDEMAAKFDEATEKAQSLRDRLKEIEETVEESDTTFSDMKDSWVSALMDMDKTAEDWAQDIGRMMAQRIIEQFIMTSTLQPLLDRLQEAFNTAMGAEGATWQSVLADDAVNTALSEIETAYPTMQAIVRDIMDRLGIAVEEEAEENNPFADLRSTFVSSLMDLEADAESFGKDIARTLIEQMMDEILKKNGFQEQIEALGEEWQAALEAGDTEAIERIRQKLIELREQAGEAVKPLLDDLDALKDKVEEDVATPFDNLRDSILSALMDMENGMENFAKNLNNIITQAFIDKFVLGDAFDAKLEEWKSQYAAIMGDADLDEEERARQLKALQSLIEEYSKQMQGEANAIHDLMGTSTYEDQSATMNMSDKATYEQMDQYLGTQMGIYIATEQGNTIRQQILATLQAMSGITSPNGDTVREIRNMLSVSNEYLLDIKRSNREILKKFGAKLDNIVGRLDRVL